METKYKFIGDPSTYDWDEEPVQGKIYGGSYKFGSFSNTLEGNFRKSSEEYFKGETSRVEYFNFLTDWEVVVEEEVPVKKASQLAGSAVVLAESKLEQKVRILEARVAALDTWIWDIEKRLR